MMNWVPKVDYDNYISMFLLVSSLSDSAFSCETVYVTEPYSPAAMTSLWGKDRKSASCPLLPLL